MVLTGAHPSGVQALEVFAIVSQDGSPGVRGVDEDVRIIRAVHCGFVGRQAIHASVANGLNQQDA
ncbi:MAG TPA: hypothetical protein PJ994_12930 [Tepidiformaceae bacterium]|nr:hypothetical protein [Tepidiformaceae bacterium]HMO96458.1 hypothetical protein [Tepidiformaceae bacterium]